MRPYVKSLVNLYFHILIHEGYNRGNRKSDLPDQIIFLVISLAEVSNLID